MYPISQLLHCFSTLRAGPEKGLAWRWRHATRNMAAGCLLGLAAVCSVHAQALLPGKAVAWGTYLSPTSALPATVPSSLTDVAAVAGGTSHSLALKKDGTVVAWGDNSQGQTNVPSNLSGVIAIAAGDGYSLALKTDGTVTAWGNNRYGQLNVPPDLQGVTAIAAGVTHALALRNDGTVVAWGSNQVSQLAIPTGLDHVVAIAAGGYHSLALRDDGTFVGWGYNAYGQATVPTALIGKTVKALAGLAHASAALLDDGTVFAWGANGNGQTNVPVGLQGIVAIAAGSDYMLALTDNGNVVAWGSNGTGASSPPAGLAGVNTIAAGYYHGLAANAVPLAKPYTLSGFLSPVNNPPAVNLARSGKTYPLKWQLKDSSGAWVGALSAITSLTYQPVQCGQFTGNLNEIAEVSLDAAGESALRYDDLANQYLFNWKTPGPGCYVVSIGLDTGQSFSANFNIGK